MYQIKTFNAIADKGLNTFTPEYTINQPDNPDAYLIRSVNLLKAQFPATLKVIARAGAGVNNIPIKDATNHGIAVFNTPGSNANAVKELVISMMIATARKVFAAYDYSHQNINADISKQVEYDKAKFNGTELFGKNLLVVGLGNVGSLVANEAVNLGMNVSGYDPYLSADSAWKINNRVHRLTDLKQALKNADYVTIHVPKNKETMGLISNAEIKAMKDQVVLFNYARGGIVDNKAVVDNLGIKIQFYCTDFGDDIIADNPRVITTPHIGGSTLEAEDNGAIKAANTIMNFLENGDTVNSINLPGMKLPFNAPYRFTVMHQNVPNMVGQITTHLAQAHVNINNMANAAKAETAYTVIDVDNLNYKNQLLKQIQEIPEVRRVRLIAHR
ncbi:3-phosphoglycerate dehydrogenase family protein [Companilactobacillus keshanensis]|uniref:D-3-phosphoglycerate dehydrogenase n=1 Tax=Companilactobacillus keshanensis TaxID=2486003 RepID=A0ABW4BSY4_9LACO|nr:3-phosphoglycerate dehydrogenase family protein [Companilactobacillus keshanensis]